MISRRSLQSLRIDFLGFGELSDWVKVTLASIAGIVGVFLCASAASGEHEDIFPGHQRSVAIGQRAEKLRQLRIPQIEFHDAGVGEVVAGIRRAAWEADAGDDTTGDPRGMPIALSQAELPEHENGGALTMTLEGASLEDVLRVSMLLLDHDFRITPTGVIVFPDYQIWPRHSHLDAFYTGRYKVGAMFLEWLTTSEQFRGLVRSDALFLDQQLQDVLQLMGLRFPSDFGGVEFDREGLVLAVHTDGRGHERLESVLTLCDQGFESDLSRGRERLWARMQQIVLPAIDFRGGSFRDAVGELSRLSVINDSRQDEPSAKGVPIRVEEPFLGGGDRELPKVDLQLRNVPLGDALRFVTEIGGLALRLEPPGASIGPRVCEGYPEIRRFRIGYDLVPRGDDRASRVIHFLKTRGVDFIEEPVIKCVPDGPDLVIALGQPVIGQVEAALSGEAAAAEE